MLSPLPGEDRRPAAIIQVKKILFCNMELYERQGTRRGIASTIIKQKEFQRSGRKFRPPFRDRWKIITYFRTFLIRSGPPRRPCDGLHPTVSIRQSPGGRIGGMRAAGRAPARAGQGRAAPLRCVMSTESRPPARPGAAAGHATPIGLPVPAYQSRPTNPSSGPSPRPSCAVPAGRWSAGRRWCGARWMSRRSPRPPHGPRR